MTVSHGRALAVAAGWIVAVLTIAATAVALSFPEREGWDAIVPGLAVGGVLVLTPLALLAAGIWVARRGGRARSAAALGTQAALIGLAVAGLTTAVFIATHR